MGSKLPAVVLVACVLVVSGCGRTDPQFSYREGLLPPVQEYVRTTVDQKFGTPHQIRVSDKLPLQPHAAVATVGEGSQDVNLVIQLTETHREIAQGQEVTWIGGTTMPAGSPPILVDSFDKDSNILKLSVAPGLTPKPGDKIVIGPGAVLTHGRQLYAEHCQHCHGVAGDGQGPTAPYLNVRPRDYRKGLFKFTSTKPGLKAHRQDLARIVEDGIPGTYMPSFKLLKPEESHAIIEYVLFLAMRGETEHNLQKFLSDSYSVEKVATLVADGESTEEKILKDFATSVKAGELDEKIAEQSDQMNSTWSEAQTPESLIVPKEKRYLSDDASIQRGRELFLSKDLDCAKCHGESGLGDGPQTTSITKNAETGKDNPEPGLYDDWGNKLKPRNLRLGMYRGGRRPIDIYSRIEAGIKGTPMSAFGAKMTEQQKWDLVNYVLHLPHEERAPGTGVGPKAPATPATPATPVAATTP